MQSTKKSDRTNHVMPKFPKRFLWGVATSAHQYEGSNRNQWTAWEDANASTLAAQSEYTFGELDAWSRIADTAKSPENYQSDMAVDHYNRYETDFVLAKKMGLNAWRFSVEWSRIEPDEGAWNAAEIEHYKAYIAGLKKAGLEPILTLFHFSLPQWFSEKGGFAKRSNVDYFVRFAEKIVTELGTSIRYIITINEPTVYATESYLEGNWPPQRTSRREWLAVVNHLALAHKKTARALHALNRRVKISVAQNCAYVYAGDDAWLSQVSARIGQYVHDDFFLKKVAKHCDFLAVNYYASDRFYGYRVHNPDQVVSDLGWDLAPENIEYALVRLHKKYKLPIIVTENGLADETDEHRIWWLSKTIGAMQRALSQGVQLEGYCHWSLLDNFEWDKGFWPKFGLFAVDRKTLKRTPRESAKWLQRFLREVKNG